MVNFVTCLLEMHVAALLWRGVTTTYHAFGVGSWLYGKVAAVYSDYSYSLYILSFYNTYKGVFTYMQDSNMLQYNTYMHIVITLGTINLSWAVCQSSPCG